MSGEIIYVPRPKHVCNTPEVWNYRLGTLWQCPCDAVWEVVKNSSAYRNRPRTQSKWIKWNWVDRLWYGKKLKNSRNGVVK